MIFEDAELDIESAICGEIMNIEKEHGKFYCSNHEGYAILKEEVEETLDDLTSVINSLNALWMAVKNDSDDEIKEYLEGLQIKAKMLCCESVQVAAVTRKFLNTMRG